MNTWLETFFRRSRGEGRQQDERVLLTTFWPGDYRREAVSTLDGSHYRVTRVSRSVADPRFFEVWGKVVTQGEVHPQESERPTHRFAGQQAG